MVIDFCQQAVDAIIQLPRKEYNFLIVEDFKNC